MKQLLFLAVMLLSMSITAQKSVNRLMDTFKDDENTYGARLPGWLLDRSIDFVKLIEKNEDLKKLTLLKEKISQVRFLFNSNQTLNIDKAIAKFIHQASKDKLVPFATVKSGATNVSVYTLEKNKIIKQLFFLIHDTETTIMVHLKTKISEDELSKIDFTFNAKK